MRSHEDAVPSWENLLLAVSRGWRISSCSGIRCSLVLPLCNEGLCQTAMIQRLLCVIRRLRASASRCWRRRCSVCCPQGRRSSLCVRSGLLQQPARPLPQADGRAYLLTGYAMTSVTASPLQHKQDVRRMHLHRPATVRRTQHGWPTREHFQLAVRERRLLSVFSHFRVSTRASFAHEPRQTVKRAHVHRQARMIRGSRQDLRQEGFICVPEPTCV